MANSFFYEDNDLALRIRDGRNMTFPAHRQKQFEYVYILDGRCQVDLEGTRYTLAAGESMAIWPYKAHAYWKMRDLGYSFLMCIVDTSLIPEYTHTFTEYDCIKPFIPAASLNPKIPEILSDLNRNVDMNVVLQKLYVGVLLGHLFEGLALEPSQAGFPHNDTVYNLLSYISRHVDEPLTLDSLAEALYLSKFTISKILSERVGCNLRTYINTLRVSLAQTLMSDPTTAMTDIIRMCGFESERTFYRAFQTHLHMSPKAVQEQLAQDAHGRESGVRIKMNETLMS